MGEVIQALLEEWLANVFEDAGLFPLVVMLGGVFLLAMGLFNGNGFMNHEPAAFFVQKLTRRGARLFFILLGAGLIAVGFLIPAGYRLP
jgi:predicted small integral membrane protein